MEWALTFLLVHILALASAFASYKGAPCWMQRLFIAGLIVTMAAFVLGYALEMVGIGIELSGDVLSLARKIEHFALLIYLFKLVLKKDEATWAKLSAPSASSLRS